MNLFFGEASVTLLFGVDPNVHCLFIDVEKDELHIDGFRLLTTKKEFSYTEKLLFEKNKDNKKVRIKTLHFGGKILAIDCGFDGRIFFKFFTRKEYSTFRGKPMKTFSYWHDRSNAVKKFYNDNLATPCNVWPVQYKKEVIA